MTNQAQIRIAYAENRCALMQTQTEFRWLLRALLDRGHETDADQERVFQLRDAVEHQRQRIRTMLRELTRIGDQARVFPGLLDRAIEDARRLYRERGRRRF